MPEGSILYYILISLGFSAYFSGMEIAFVSANRFQIEIDKKEGSIANRIVSFFQKDQSRFISTMLVGNNIALVVYGILMAALLEPFLLQYVSSSYGVLFLQTAISTAIVLFTAEFLPKVIFQINPNSALSIFSIPTLIIYYLFIPLSYITVQISDFILRKVLKIDIKQEDVSFSKIDLDNYLNEIESTDSDTENFDNEVQILRNALDFSNVKARECMIPRTEIKALPEDASIAEISDLFYKTGLSKLIIYKENLDDIIGYVHSFEMFKKPKKITDILLPITVIPETMPANQILELLIKQKKSIVVVVDEFGGTAGLLTLEDIVEEIFGDIEDEHDTENLVEKKVSENEYEFSARLEIDYLNEAFNLELPLSDDYETLAGFIIHHHESIPEMGELITIPPFSIKILKVNDTRIDRVSIKII